MEDINVDNSEVITTIEWCAGYGGIGLGLKAVYGGRVRCLAYSDVEGFVQANLVSKMESGLMDEAPIWPNLKSFPNKHFHGLVDVFIAGYPCQPFSYSGKRRGTKDPRHLWPFIKRAVGIIRPRLCFFENVAGHLTLGFKDVCHDLDELGYEVTAGLFTAAEVGAPHNRKRLFILASNNDFRLSHGKFTLDATEAGLDAQRDLAPGREAALADTELGASGERRESDLLGGRQRGPEQVGMGRIKRGTESAGAEMANPCRDGRDGRGLPDGSEERNLPESAQREGEGTVLRGQATGRRKVRYGGGGEAVAHPDDARASRLGEHGRADGQDTAAGIRPGSAVGRGKGGAALPDSQGAGLHEHERESGDVQEAVGAPEGEDASRLCPEGKWPSRPGQQQHGWEPPRVVGHAKVGQDDGRGPGDLEEAAGEGGRIDDAARGASEGMGDAAVGNGLRAARQADKHAPLADEDAVVGETQPPVGGDANGVADGVDRPEFPGLDDKELADIYGGMVSGTNRTDELRLCGNGVVPATAALAWRTLYAELTGGGR